jgi:hypothetical protein
MVSNVLLSLKCPLMPGSGGKNEKIEAAHGETPRAASIFSMLPFPAKPPIDLEHQ